MVKEGSRAEENKYKVFLVTNRHVLEGHESVWLRFNPEGDEPAREFELRLEPQKEDKPACESEPPLEPPKKEKPACDSKLPMKAPTKDKRWFSHEDPKIDLAIVPINTNVLKKEKIKFSFFLSDQHVLYREKAKEDGVSEGDGAFVLGFPMGLVGASRNYVIVRQGTIARVRDYLAGSSSELLIDATIFPGNSGGPVITKPEITSIEGTKSQNAAYLLGVVQGYLPYRDVAISAQTKQPRIIFEENSSLASVIPMDYVRDIIKQYLKTHPFPASSMNAIHHNPSG